MNIIEITTQEYKDVTAWCQKNFPDGDITPFRYPFENNVVIKTDKEFDPDSTIPTYYDSSIYFQHVEGLKHQLVLARNGIKEIEIEFRAKPGMHYDLLNAHIIDDYAAKMISETHGLMDKDSLMYQSFNATLLKTFVVDTVEKVIRVFTYFMYHQNDFENIEIKERRIIKKKGRYQKAKGKNAIKITTTYKLARPVVTKSEKARIKREFKAEAWGVRGHLRHLKNGKVIEIKPYIKGKKRDKVPPPDKTYRI